MTSSYQILTIQLQLYFYLYLHTHRKQSFQLARTVDIQVITHRVQGPSGLQHGLAAPGPSSFSSLRL